MILQNALKSIDKIPPGFNNLIVPLFLQYFFNIVAIFCNT